MEKILVNSGDSLDMDRIATGKALKLTNRIVPVFS